VQDRQDTPISRETVRTQTVRSDRWGDRRRKKSIANHLQDDVPLSLRGKEIAGEAEGFAPS